MQTPSHPALVSSLRVRKEAQMSLLSKVHLCLEQLPLCGSGWYMVGIVVISNSSLAPRPLNHFRKRS